MKSSAVNAISWFEPAIVMAGLGVAIVINAGSNLIFGENSFFTKAAGNILKLAVSVVYSVLFPDYRIVCSAGNVVHV